MSLIYSLVSKDQQVLADYTRLIGNFHHSAIEVLQKTPSSRQFGQLLVGQYTFYTSSKDGFVFLVLVDSSYELRIAFRFLRQIQEEFFAKYDEETRRAAVAHSLQDFRPILHKWMDKYENKYQVDKLAKLKGDLTEVEKITLRNLDKVIDRGEILAVIVEKSKDAANISYDIVDMAKETNRKLWLKKNGLKIAIGLIAVIMVVLVVVLVIL